ncbi:divergent AAA domain protein [Clostridium acetireducens DSM 10703]|uniref:Divergent AAA domain protein n=1 Tax=Clostridium acetireducens DSM 10703 TaxID=1121290 RepID=A0A1E8F1P6_9CLOT|nr:RNA-binding domain-containing protein [Clostridium acetireducens]OFI07434.1 divergent AAA domain protein [Clostridium acetireducens DSM 10703]
MDKKKFINLIKKEEGPKLDFKQKIDLVTESGRKELAKDICAIANSKGGRGYLIIGIEDKTKNIVGIEDLKISEEQVQQIVSSRIDPPVPVNLETIYYENKKLISITVFDGPQKPYQLRDNGAFYVRRGSTNDVMRKQEIISALQENLTLNIELCPIVNSDIKCIDLNIVYKYFKSQGIEINDNNYLELMENSSIIYLDREINKYMVTLGGMLIFCRSNYIYIPHNMIKIVNRINNKLDKYIIIKGDLLTMLDEAEKVLYRILPKKYPTEAICESIKNAVLYRDYTIYYKEIEVILDYNSISVSSPGILVKGKNIVSSYYIKRNMWLYEKLITLDDKGRFIKSGKGFRRIKKAFKNKEKIKFINSLKEDNFKVIYPGIKKYI